MKMRRLHLRCFVIMALAMLATCLPELSTQVNAATTSGMLHISGGYPIHVSGGTFTPPAKLFDKHYLRTKGKPKVYTDSFTSEYGQGKLIIENGTETGKNRISSAIIAVNGVEIFSPDDFNQNVHELAAPINLAEENSISVELRSKPGSYLAVKVFAEQQQVPTLNEWGMVCLVCLICLLSFYKKLERMVVGYKTLS